MRLIDQPWRIMTIGMRDWTHGFCSTGVGMTLLPEELAIVVMLSDYAVMRAQVHGEP